MSKAKNVIDFYVLTNKLKHVIRTGWKNWNVDRERIESVAEHVYGVQMLAIAIYSEYSYNIDLKKVLYMLAIHELEEIYIGDLTQFEISKEKKRKIGQEAVSKVLDNLLNRKELIAIIEEFEERRTKEALFAYYCDKLECDLQCKLYDEEGCVDLNNQHDNVALSNYVVKELLNQGKSWGEMWLQFGQVSYNYDENFLQISNYALNNKIFNKNADK